jgi:PIN domain
VIYLDSSVVLAQLFGEQRTLPVAVGNEYLTSSQLLQYEVWNRIHARGLTRSHGQITRGLLSRVTLLALSPPILARALDPFPVAVRTLDALHLASIEYLRQREHEIMLATFDRRLLAGALALGIPIYDG